MNGFIPVAIATAVSSVVRCWVPKSTRKCNTMIQVTWLSATPKLLLIEEDITNNHRKTLELETHCIIATPSKQNASYINKKNGFPAHHSCLPLCRWVFHSKTKVSSDPISIHLNSSPNVSTFGVFHSRLAPDFRWGFYLEKETLGCGWNPGKNDDFWWSLIFDQNKTHGFGESFLRHPHFTCLKIEPEEIFQT